MADESNPFETDNTLEDVSLSMSSKAQSQNDESELYADESVQKSLKGKGKESTTTSASGSGLEAGLLAGGETHAFEYRKNLRNAEEFGTFGASPGDAFLSGNIDKRSSSSSSSTANLDSETKIASSNFLGRCLSCLPCFSLEYYQVYFNVDTKDVLERGKLVFMPWRKDFFQIVDANPDLYSPFWICTTLILLTAVTSNISKSLAKNEPTDLKVDIRILTLALSIIYGFGIAMPAVAYAGFQYVAVGSNIRFMELVCLYGYSLSPFMAAAFLCMIPSSLVEWLVIILAFALSASFLVRNLIVRVQADGGSIQEIVNTKSEEGRKTSLILMVALLGLHLTFSLLLKTMFFNNSN